MNRYRQTGTSLELFCFQAVIQVQCTACFSAVAGAASIAALGLGDLGVYLVTAVALVAVLGPGHGELALALVGAQLSTVLESNAACNII